MASGILLVLIFLAANSNAQYFDPVLFEQDGKGEVSEPSESVPDEMMQDQPLKDDPKDTSAKIASKISNAAERKPAETMASLRKGIVRKPGLVIERWDGVDGYDINTLTKSPRFPTLPNFQDYVDTYSEPDNWGDSFGSRIRGYFCPDQTGNHIFQIASDAQGQLYLSPDENPAHKVMIAEISGDRVVPPRVYNKYREQTSQFVYLEKDKCYYTSAIHKEQFLDDNLSVKVIMPDKRSFDPIPKQFLWTLPKPKPTEPEGSGDPMGLLRVAAKAGARAGAKLGMEEAAKKGAEAGAIAGEKAGVQAGAQAGAVAARKAATEIAVKALQQIMANMTSNKHVVNVYTSANGSSSSAATTNVNVNAGANSNAAGKANASGEGQGTGTGTPGGPGGPGGDGSTGKGKPGGTDGGAPGITKPVLEPKSGENIKKLAEKYTTKSGSAKRIIIGAAYILHSMNIPAAHDFRKNLCWRGKFGRVVLGRMCQVFIARKGFVEHEKGQQTVAWESGCAPGYFIIQKNYNFKLAKYSDNPKFLAMATLTAFRTLKFPAAFMFELARHQGWFVCESLDSSFHITNLVARYNEPTITWIQRCSFVIRYPTSNEPLNMNCYAVLPQLPVITRKPTIVIKTNSTFTSINLTTPTPATTPPPPKKVFVLCLRTVFINEAGFPYRLFSNIKPGGYYVYGKNFVVKYVLPKLTVAVPTTKPKEDIPSQYLGKRDTWDAQHSMPGFKYSRSVNERTKLYHKVEKAKKVIKRTKKSSSNNRERTKKSKTPTRQDSKKRHYKKIHEQTENAVKKSLTGTNEDLSLKSAHEVLNAISPVSSVTSPRQNDVIEAFPRDGIAGNRPTHIVFSAEDPLGKYDLLINGKKNITIIIDSECRYPHNLQLVVTKRPFTTIPPPTTITTPRTTPPTTLPLPPPLPNIEPPPPPIIELPPPPPPLIVTTASTSPTPAQQSTTPTATVTTTATPTTQKPTPPTTLPTTASPPPLPPIIVAPPPPVLPPPPPPLPPPTQVPVPPPAVIVLPIPAEAGCMPTHEGTSNGACCKFPFIYQGKKQNGCIRAERKYRWCATSENYDKDKQWGFCPHCYLAHGGTAGGQCCHFPFVFKGKMYMQCLKDSNGKPWCATTFSFDKDKKFGYCGDSGKAPGTQPCNPACKSNCLPTCPVKCCMGSAAQGKGANCPPQCAQVCEPDCPAKCCTGILKLTNNKPGTKECPQECFVMCKPYCPQKCCMSELTPIEPKSKSCPDECKQSCKPDCPVRCCKGFMIEEKTWIENLPCPSQCSPTSCRPSCPIKCCTTIVLPTGSKAKSCPAQCSQSSCQANCPAQCCQGPTNTKAPDTTACPPQCLQSCKPDCPARCCPGMMTTKVPDTAVCPSQCLQKCKPDCPVKCCSGTITTAAPETTACLPQCLETCKPDCPAKCCAGLVPAEKTEKPTNCPPQCVKVCNPGCPLACCLGGSTSNSGTQQCPQECSHSNCKPDCPEKCCLTILTPMKAACPAQCNQNSCSQNCPQHCCPVKEGCPAECSSQSCNPECPAKCCTKVSTPLKSDSCPPICIKICRPGCPPKCCKNEATPTESPNCPPECAQKCTSECPPKCCFTILQPLQTCPPACNEQSCEENCPDSCCPKPVPTTPPQTATCLPSCEWACLPSCPRECCAKEFPGEDQVRSQTRPYSCPSECLVSCQPNCPFKCCLEAFTKAAAQSAQVAKLKTSNKCPTSCFTKCSPSCPVKCCSIVVTYDKKTNIAGTKLEKAKVQMKRGYLRKV